MTFKNQLLPEQPRVQELNSATTPLDDSTQVVFTRDREVIRRWAEQHQAEPATGEATASGPATVNVADGGAGIRFNFPGLSAFRPITWDEWFANFDEHECAFVFDNASSTPPSNRYRIVKARDWKVATEG
jgi:hypothetical protein